MHTVMKQYRTETGHRLIDYDGKCSHLHGHSYLWEVSAQRPQLTGNGMVTDFKNLKAAMKIVLEPLDHCMVLADMDPLVGVPQGLESLFVATNGEAPRLRLFPFNPTAENFAKWAAEEIQHQMLLEPDEADVVITSVRVWETVTSCAEWLIDKEDA